MQKNVEIGDRLGYLDIHDGMLVGINEAKQLAPDEIVFLVTGSQAEPRAALYQLATQIYKGITIEETDTVVLSARIIPGNERAISKLIGHIYKRGANIIEEKRRLIHVSGHASQDDIRIMTEAVRPKFVVPIHGEYRMLFRHKEFVKNHLGYAEENIVLIENGDILELDGERATIVGKKDIKRTFIDESGFEEIEYDTVRERKKLAYEGIITFVVVIDRKTGVLQSPPQIVAQGVRGFESTNGLTSEAQNVIASALAGASRQTFDDESLLKEHVRLELKRFIQKETGAKPVIVPVIQQM
jgi:ribonuclease J